MQTVQENVFARDDTFFGVCEALGQDLGFNPIYLRIVFGVGLIASPFLVVGVYAAAGLLVLGSRLLFPNPRRPVVEAEAAPAPAPLAAENNNQALAAAA